MTTTTQPKTRTHGSPAFYAMLEQMADIHEKKSKDYGSLADPLANCKSSEQFNVPAWIGVLIRVGDKMQRIKSFIEKGTLANESIEDALLDHATYAVIAAGLYMEGKAADLYAQATESRRTGRLSSPHHTPCHRCGGPTGPDHHC